MDEDKKRNTIQIRKVLANGLNKVDDKLWVMLMRIIFFIAVIFMLFWAILLYFGRLVGTTAKICLILWIVSVVVWVCMEGLNIIRDSGKGE